MFKVAEDIEVPLVDEDENAHLTARKSRKSTYNRKDTTHIVRSRKSEAFLSHSRVIFSGVGIIGSALNITNTIIGGGILELPYIMSKLGVIITAFLIIFTFYLTIMSVKYLVLAKNFTGKTDYKSQAGFAF